MDEREQLEKAIAALEAQRILLGDEVVDAGIKPLREKLAAMADPTPHRRRLATILFMDIVGSTDLVGRMDPEDAMILLDQALQLLAKPVFAHGGRVTRFMGDGFLALFGIPIARENEPEMAIRAGLAIQAEARAYAATLADSWGIASFQIRLGINTGMVFTGGQTEARDTIMGIAVNLASRLESAAPPGGLLISQATYQHVRGVFEFVTQQPLVAKGFPEPVPTYLVKGLTPRTFHTRRRGVAGIFTRMVGRHKELDALREATESIVEIGLQQLTIAGQAGIGKSRLLLEYETWLSKQPQVGRVLKGRAWAETEGTPYGLLRNVFANYLDIRDDDRATIARDKMISGLLQTLATAGDCEMKVHFIGQLLGFDFTASPHLADVAGDSRQIHHRALNYLVEFLILLTEESPVILIIEDLHWADESSLDVIARLRRSLRRQPILLLGTARPPLFERRPSWCDEPEDHLRLDLGPLDEATSHRLVTNLLHKVSGLTADLGKFVVRNADGNPFYLEELVTMLIEEGVIIKDEPHWHIKPGGLKTVRVPATLTGVLQARLDRLSAPERLLLQQASVVGRTFWDQVICHLNEAESGDPLPLEDVQANLSILEQKEFVFGQGRSAFSQAQEYIFKHVILQEVTYDSVLRSLRRTFHGLVADWLIQQSGERIGEIYGLIGDHLERAGRIAAALDYLSKAGESAAAAYANEEAVGYFTRALLLVPDSAPKTRFDLLLAREKIHSLAGEREAQLNDLQEMRQLAALLGDMGKETELALEYANYFYDIGNFQESLQESHKAITLARQSNDPLRQAQGLRLGGLSLTMQSDYEAARRQFEKALILAHQSGDKNVEAAVYNSLGPVASAQGHYHEAQAYYKQAIALAQEMGDRYIEGAAVNNIGNIFWNLGDYPAASENYQQALAIASAIGDRQGEAITSGNLGVITADMGQYAQARIYHEQAHAYAVDIGDRRIERVALNNLGGIALVMGDHEEAHQFFERALTLAIEIGDRYGEGYVLDHMCDSLIALGKLSEAVEVGQKAVTIRQTLGQPQLTIESRASLARAQYARGDMMAAREQIEIIEEFVEQGGSLEGASEPFRIFLTCVQVLQAFDDPRAGDLLETAYNLLQTRATRIQDQELRRFFMEQVADNRAIVALWQAEQDAASDERQ